MSALIVAQASKKPARRERRRSPRRTVAASVYLRHPALGEQKMQMADMSDGGLFLRTGYHIAPPVGAQVEVIIKRLTGAVNDTPVLMEVVHRREGGLGLKFL